jgi:hypothetical protein
MADELTLESIKDMSKADYIKAFKNKSLWKKANAVIFLVDYKLDGKKTCIAIPFRKEAEMKMKIKEIKKDKIHIMKKTGGGVITVENDGPEGLKAKVELKLGGLAPEFLQIKGEELFDKIKATLEVKIAADAEMEPAEAVSDSEAVQVEQKTKSPSNDAEIFNQVKALMQTIVALFKDKIQAIILPAVKNNDAKKEYLDEAEALTEKIEQFEELVEQLSDAVKDKIKDKVQQILALIPGIGKIKNKINAILSAKKVENKVERKIQPEKPAAKPDAEGNANPDKVINDELDKILNSAESQLNEAVKTTDKTQKELKNAEKTKIPAGKDLLAALS